MRDKAEQASKDSSITILVVVIMANIADFLYKYAIDGETWIIWTGKIVVVIFCAYMGVKISAWWQAKGRAIEKDI